MKLRKGFTDAFMESKAKYINIIVFNLPIVFNEEPQVAELRLFQRENTPVWYAALYSFCNEIQATFETYGEGRYEGDAVIDLFEKLGCDHSIPTGLDAECTAKVYLESILEKEITSNKII